MLNPRLLERLDAKKARLDGLRPLPAAILRRLREEMAIEWTYNSNAIEGSTLTLRETRLILETGLTIGAKSLREHFEALNHREAIDYVEALASGKVQLTPYHVRQIHKLILARIDDENAGQYRTTPVRITGAAHQPPEAWEVPHRMSEWGDRLVSMDARRRHPVELAALAHHQLTSIHPFLDGNGRTARLVMNLLLFRKGFPPAIIQQTYRRQYYRTLAQADAGNEAPVVNLVGRALERSLTLYIEAATPRVRPRSAKEEWIPLREAARRTPYSQEYLSLLARTGRLEAVKRGRVWHTTRKALAAYRKSVKGRR